MSVQSFGFGARLYNMFDAVWSHSLLRNLFNCGEVVPRHDEDYTARWIVQSNPIIMKLCSSRVINSSISYDIRCDHCVFGYVVILKKNPCVSQDYCVKIITCTEIPSSGGAPVVLLILQKIQQMSSIPGEDICFLFPGTRLQERRIS